MRRVIYVFALLALVAFVLWRLGGVVPRAPWSRASPAAIAPSDPRASSRASTRPEDRSPLADALNSPSTDIQTDLRLVSDILTTFRTNFPRAGNPVGNNAEITAALTGRNRLQLSLVPAGHPAINARGELCDRWGTPFFFHAESATQMEIRSAGPDRKLWTPDDVVQTP